LHFSTTANFRAAQLLQRFLFNSITERQGEISNSHSNQVKTEAAGVTYQTPTPVLFQNFWIRIWVRCQANFLTSAKFLTCYCFSVILLLSIKKQSLAITFSMCIV